MKNKDQYFDELIWNRTGFPDKVSPDEDIILVVREDIIIPLIRAIIFISFVLVLLLIRIFVQSYAGVFLLSIYDTVFGSLVALMCISFILMYHNFFLSLQIVTNKRVIDIDQKGLFNREINTMPVSNIEDISFKMSGFAGTIFNYGNVILQTAGSSLASATPNSSITDKGAEDNINGFTFNNVPNPKEVTNILNKVFHDNETRDRIEAAQLNAQAMKDIFQSNNRP
jgi:hypothetical protein